MPLKLYLSWIFKMLLRAFEKNKSFSLGYSSEPGDKPGDKILKHFVIAVVLVSLL